MCIQFVEKSGDYDFVSTPLNFLMNGVALAYAGGISALIVAIALKNLGYTAAAVATRSNALIFMGAIGIGVSVLGTCTMTAMVCYYRIF